MTCVFYNVYRPISLLNSYTAYGRIPTVWKKYQMIFTKTTWKKKVHISEFAFVAVMRLHCRCMSWFGDDDDEDDKDDGHCTGFSIREIKLSKEAASKRDILKEMIVKQCRRIKKKTKVVCA